MFDVYQELILRFYENKQRENDLSLNMVNPTPAKIKKECELVCHKRFSRKDGRVLEAFFEEGNDQPAILRAIRRCEADRFKPLIKFLRKETGSTSENNIELLAWLIDFNPRPFEVGRVYNPDEAGGKIIDEGTHPHDPELNDPEPEMPSGKSAKPQNELYLPEAPALVRVKKKLNFKLIATPVMIAIVVLAGIFIYKEKGNTLPMGIFAGSPVHNSGHCMYWAGDHYEPTPCTPKRGDTLLVELDSAKLFRLKKIIRPETITKDDIGRVAYIKLDDRIEYYTDTGFHPVYTHKRLKPLTKFMFDKYILPQKP